MGALKQQVPEATKHFSKGCKVVQPWVVEKISEVDGQSTTMEGTGESPLEEGQNFLAKLQAPECRTEGAILQSQNVLQVAAQQVQEQLGTKLQGITMSQPIVNQATSSPNNQNCSPEMMMLIEGIKKLRANVENVKRAQAGQEAMLQDKWEDEAERPGTTKAPKAGGQSCPPVS